MIWSTKCWKVRECSAIICWRENEKSRGGLPIFVTLIGRGRLSRELGGVFRFLSRVKHELMLRQIDKMFWGVMRLRDRCFNILFYFYFGGVLWF